MARAGIESRHRPIGSFGWTMAFFGIMLVALAAVAGWKVHRGDQPRLGAPVGPGASPHHRWPGSPHQAEVLNQPSEAQRRRLRRSRSPRR